MKIRARWLNKLIAVLGTMVFRMLFLTVRWRHIHVHPEGTPYARATGRQRYTFCLWHDNILLCIFGHRTYQLSGLISQHVDGGYLADVARICGIEPVRGSTTRGGASAVRKLLEMPEMHLAITPDGPQGPMRKMKDGVGYLSARADRPIVPTAICGNSMWLLKGRWSHLSIPKPFSRVVAIAGAPITLPRDATRDDIDRLLPQVTSEMRRLEIIGERLLKGDETAASWIDRPGQLPEDWSESSGHDTDRAMRPAA